MWGRIAQQIDVSHGLLGLSEFLCLLWDPGTVRTCDFIHKIVIKVVIPVLECPHILAWHQEGQDEPYQELGCREKGEGWEL